MSKSEDQPPKLTADNISTRLGWVSFFNDVSGEAISRALPLVLTGELGSSATLIGIIEGIAEALSIFLKGISGWVSDRLASRKPLVVAGYSLSCMAKILMYFAGGPGLIAISRWSDRIGKGLRSAPRDAMIADIADKGATGKHFGINRFLDTLGAMTGIVLVLLLGAGSTKLDLEQFRRIALLSIPFAVIAVGLLVWTVPKIPRTTVAKPGLSLQAPKSIRKYLALVGFFAISQSSDAFLVLRAKELGMSFSGILICFLVFNFLAAALSIPVGKLSDRYGKRGFLAVGWLLYALCYAVFGLSTEIPEFAVALCLYGAFYGFTEAVEKALLADLLPAEDRGRGFGAFQVVLGSSALPASLAMGFMMMSWGSKWAFLITASIALISVFALPWATTKTVKS